MLSSQQQPDVAAAQMQLWQLNQAIAHREQTIAELRLQTTQAEARASTSVLESRHQCDMWQKGCSTARAELAEAQQASAKVSAEFEALKAVRGVEAECCVCREESSSRLQLACGHVLCLRCSCQPVHYMDTCPLCRAAVARCEHCHVPQLSGLRVAGHDSAPASPAVARVAAASPVVVSPVVV